MKKKLPLELRYIGVGSWFGPKAWLFKVKRLVWNRGVKLCWQRLWIRRDEFHDSLHGDLSAILAMSRKQRRAYRMGLIQRRQVAHEADY
ncbi:MAG: hypothetical protein WCT37_01800 [Patescibacteria group bacterium]|jgi:hypothetical protein